jgi:hypothetical protein
MTRDRVECRVESKLHALGLANRVLHIATTTLQIAKDWTNTSYLLEYIGPSSCVMRRIPFLDTSEEYIFDGTIQALCWVRLQDGAIVVHSEDDYQHILIRLNYTKLNDSSNAEIIYGVPACTIEDKKDKIKQVENNSSKSPASVIQESSPINMIRPVPTFDNHIPSFFTTTTWFHDACRDPKSVYYDERPILSE